MGMIKNAIKRIVPAWMMKLYHKIRCTSGIILCRIRYSLFGIRIEDPKRIPIIINNFNRLDYLKQLISSLTARGYENIYIIDNDSTYPPLLEYYDTCGFEVFRLKENVGYLALWKTEIYGRFKKSYYVYTDSDMRICDGCPDDFMTRFLSIINKYPLSQKVGFGLLIDDLPDSFKNKQNVIEHESRFWKDEVEEGVYAAEIDTTFALYRPFCSGKADKYQKTYRTGTPYLIHHLPWYVDSENMTNEEQYYVRNVRQSTHWYKQS